MLSIVMLLAALMLGGPASAQTVYKCTHDGKISYGDQPCRNGASVVMPTPAAPEVFKQDQATLSREKKEMTKEMAKEMAKEVARLENAQRKEIALAGRNRERASRAAAAQNKKCAALQLNRKWALEDARAANAGTSGNAAHDRQAAQASVKARRAAEKLALECPA